jgi:hypothetical protein
MKKKKKKERRGGGGRGRGRRRMSSTEFNYNHSWLENIFYPLPCFPVVKISSVSVKCDSTLYFWPCSLSISVLNNLC